MKPSLPQGVRDFLPDTVQKRNYLFNTIRTVMQRFAFVPIETPSIENLNTLTGKYGDEGDKLIFKILNNGDYLKKANKDFIAEGNSDKLIPSIAKRGLRYDLTVPFARYVVMNRNELSFPFKRYQIQPVWRADRPQKNRYREFFQCDADIVGSESLMYEAELMQIYDQVFDELRLPVTIRINNRKILTGISQKVSSVLSPVDIISAIDRIDKVGIENVKNDILSKDDQADVDLLGRYLSAQDIKELNDIDHPLILNGIKELQSVFIFLDEYIFKNSLRWDPKLARGLDYYTGCIFEVAADHNTSVSIGGGGRYANLTEIFGVKDMSGVGISFGADRIYNMLNELGLWPEATQQTGLILIASDSDNGIQRGFNLSSILRNQGFKVSNYPEPAKWKKQFKYADQIGAHHVIIIGEQELLESKYSVKNLKSGEQRTFSLEELKSYLRPSE